MFTFNKYNLMILAIKVIVLLLLVIRLSQLCCDYSLLTTRSKRISYLKNLLQEKVCIKVETRLKLSTMAPSGTEERGHYRDVAIVGRWGCNRTRVSMFG